MNKIKEFMDVCPLPSFLFKMKNKNGICVYKNSYKTILSNEKFDKYVGKNLKEIWENIPKISENIIKCFEDNDTFKRNLTYENANNHIFFEITYSSYRKIYVIVFIKKVTEKRDFIDLQRKIQQKSKKLKRSEKEKAIILESISQMIAFQDRDHNLIWVNKASGDSVNMDPADLIGKKCYQIWNNNNVPCQYCPVEKSISEGDVVSMVQETYDERVWELKAYPVKNEDGEIIGAVEIGDDITEFTKIRLNLKKAYDSVSLYKDLLAHDINNILQNLRGSLELSELALKSPNYKEKQRELFNIMKEQILRGKYLVDNVHKLSLINNSKEANLELNDINLLEILKQALNSIKRSFREDNVKISTNFNKLKNKPPIIRANDLLINVFENLLLNSIQHNINYTKKIQIKISKYEQDDKFYFHLQFIDNGVGISDELKNKIFDDNLKHKKENGLGLGLSLVKKIMNMFNGKIWVENRDENDYTQGSIFNLLFPEII